MTSLADATAACARQEALAQRARLLSAIWADLQGERLLLKRDALPARLLGERVPNAPPLENYAAHLTLSLDGIWRVVRDDVGRHPAASVLQAPLLAAFLPGLCRLLFGQPLLLPSIPIWWLGDAETRRVLAHRGRQFWIRDGLNAGGLPVGLAALSASHRASLQSIVSTDPSRFIAGRESIAMMPTRRVTYDIAGHGF